MGRERGSGGKVVKEITCSAPKCRWRVRVDIVPRGGISCSKCGSRAEVSEDWFLSYRDAEGKPRFDRACPNKTEAEDVLRKIQEREEAKRHPQDFIKPLGNVSLADRLIAKDAVVELSWDEAVLLILHWRKLQGHSRATTSNYVNAMNAMKPVFGYFMFHHITAEMVNDHIIAFQAAGVTNDAVNAHIKALTVTSKVLAGVTKGLNRPDGKPYLPADQLASVKYLTANPSRKGFYTQREVRTLAHYASPKMRVVLYLAADAGLRLRTIREFEKSWVLFEIGMLLVPPSARKWKDASDGMLRRPMTKRLMTAIQQWLKLMDQDAYRSKYLIPSEHRGFRGNLLSDNGLDHAWEELHEVAKIEKKMFHDLKRTAGSYHYAATKDPHATQEFCDHADMKTTMEVYVQPNDSERLQAMQKFATLIGDDLPEEAKRFLEHGIEVDLGDALEPYAPPEKDPSRFFRGHAPVKWREVGKEQLTTMVWSKPTLQVAKDFGVSDRSISKKCETMGIPKPPVGFWEQVRRNRRPHPMGKVPKEYQTITKQLPNISNTQ